MKRLLAILTVASLALTAHAADFAAQVNNLIPKLAADDVGSRYAVQMELQAIAANASKPGNEADRAALGTLLAAKADDAKVPQPARVWIVRQLEYMGRGEAVAALTALMNGEDAELRECARRALEKNPDAKATESLHEALHKGGDARWKTGLVRALGEKRDAESVSLIAALLNDAQVGKAAAKALGKIASPSAIEALWGVFDKVSTAPESLVCAAGQNPSQAPAIAKKLYAQSKASAVRAAAISILAQTEPKIVEQAILDDDVRLQKAAVDAASPAVLVGLLPKLSDTAKVFALRVVDSEQAVLEHVAVKGEAVRIAALEALSRVGTAYSVPALIKAAASGTELEKNAAVASLGLVNGQGAAEAIERQAGQGESASRMIAIHALAARAAKSSVRVLLQYGADPDAAVSKAALAGVGKIGGDESLDGLVKLVFDNKPGAKDALQAVANRSANKSAVGQRLAAQAQAASGSQLAGILDVMALVGGADALAAVVKFAATGNDEAKDAGIRALCQWRDFSAVKPLLDVLAAPGAKQVHNVLAIQAVCRLVKAEDTKEAAQARVDATLAALKAAGRPQEKTQALSALASIKDRKAADAIIKLLADAATQKDAATAAFSLADGLRKQDRGSAKKLAEAVKKANISPELNKKADESLNKK